MSLNTYRKEEPAGAAEGSEDPVLKMLGVGKELWDIESGDSFVERLRSEDLPALPPTQHGPNPAESLAEAVWQRVADHQGEQFHTATGLAFTFKLEGTGIWFFRNGKRINRKLARTQFEAALSRCPLTRTTEINDLMDYSYLFAVLMDRRIRGQDW